VKFIKDGEWTISTPVFVGSVRDVEDAAACPHETWVWFSKDTHDGHLMIAERCESCIATRVRMKGEK
jgi:hypothetical protein